ncbi:hypothetical protein IJ103_02825 [Candidatus Saccharibacteria bacterium]|nr:hypothetical protein [Candidatus Saccharibacteria bacterium]MBQ9017150.1 hypothetical protein [Candidatus Saccharibacteria bacterium]
MSTKKALKRVKQPNRVLTLLSLGFVIVAVPVFILLSFHAYTLIFISPDAASLTRGISILVLMALPLGLVLFNRK